MAPNVVASVGSTPNKIVTINRVTANASNNLDAGAELNAQDETGKTALDAFRCTHIRASNTERSLHFWWDAEREAARK